jgi:hypothetical protein
MSTSDPNAPQFKPSTPTQLGRMLRSEFFALTPADQRRALAEAWRIIDDPPGTAKQVTISRAAYDGMPPSGQELFTSRGGRVE